MDGHGALSGKTPSAVNDNSLLLYVRALFFPAERHSLGRRFFPFLGERPTRGLDRRRPGIVRGLFANGGPVGGR